MSRIGNAAGNLKLVTDAVEEAVMKLVLLYLVIATIAMLAHLGARQTAELLADQTPI
jgi:hypothetical protein